MTNSLKRNVFIYVGIQTLLLTALLVPAVDYNFLIIDETKNITTVIKWFGFAIIILAILQLNKNITPFPTPKQGSQFI